MDSTLAGGGGAGPEPDIESGEQRPAAAPGAEAVKQAVEDAAKAVVDAAMQAVAGGGGGGGLLGCVWRTGVVVVLAVVVGAADYFGSSATSLWPPWDTDGDDGEAGSGSTGVSTGYNHRREDLDTSDPDYDAPAGSWRRVSFNFASFGTLLDPSKPFGAAAGGAHFFGGGGGGGGSGSGAADGGGGGLVGLLSCDGQTALTNLLGHALPFFLLGCLATGGLGGHHRPRHCAVCGVLPVVAVALGGLNVWHGFVAAGRWTDPSWVDFWLSAVGALAGWLAAVLLLCCCCCCKPAGDGEDEPAVVVAKDVGAISRSHPYTYEERQTVRLRALFAKFDSDHSGSIEAEEMSRLTKSLFQREMGLTDAAIARMLASADTDGDGKVNCDEFVAVCISGLQAMEKRKAAQMPVKRTHGADT